MNKEEYDDLVESLDGFQSAANTQMALKKSLPQGTSLENVTAILAAFYEYTQKYIKQDPGFQILADFCKNTFSSYYPENRISNDFENIVKDELLLDKLLDICNNSVIESLYKHASAMNDIYVKTGDNSYLDVYNKIREKYECKKPAIVEGLAADNTNENTAKGPDPVTQTTADEPKGFSSVSEANAQIESNNAKVSDLLWENKRIEYEKEKRAEEMLKNQASNLQSKGINITSDQLHDTIEKNGIEVAENENMYYSLSMGRLFEAKDRLLSLPFPKFVKLVEKTSGLVMKKADYDVITVDSKKSILVSSSKKTDVLASVDEKVADIGENVALKIATAKDGWHKVVNKAYCKKVEMTQMVVDTKHKAAETIKSVMTNLKTKKNKFIKAAKNKKDEFIEKANQKIEDFDNSIRENVSNAFESAARRLNEIAYKISPAIKISPEDITTLSPDENNKQYEGFSMEELRAILSHMMNYRQGIKGQDANLIASGAVLPQLSSSTGMSM